MNSVQAIRLVKDKLKLSSKELAFKLDVTTTAIYNYEKGIRIPKLSVMKLLLKLAHKNNIDISANDFLD